MTIEQNVALILVVFNATISLVNVGFAIKNPIGTRDSRLFSWGCAALSAGAAALAFLRWWQQ